MKSFIKSYLWLPALIGVTAYFRSIFYESAWGDDQLTISPISKNFSLMLKTFYDNSAVPGLHFCPVYFFQCYLINFVFGKHAFPFGFHLYQVVLHAVSCILATLIFYKITKNQLISILAISLWAVHPLNTEIIIRLGCGPAHLASSTFCLAFMLCFLKIREVANSIAKSILTILGILFFLACMTTHEQFFFFPLVILLIYFYFEGKEVLKRKDSLLFIVFPLILIYPVYLSWRFFACGGTLYETSDELIKWTEVGSLKDILFRAFWLSPQLVLHYFRLFFWPDYLAESKADWYYVGDSVFSFYSLFCQFIIIFLLLSAILLRRKIPLYSIGIMWFFTTMILVLQIVPTFSIVDEHYCHLSCLGLFLTLFSIVHYFKRFISKKVLVIFTTLVFTILLWRTELYIPSGKDLLIRYIYMTKDASLWNKHYLIALAIDLANIENRNHELPKWINEKSFEDFINIWIKKYLNLKPTLYHRFGPVQMPYNFYVFRRIFKYLIFSGQQSKLTDAMNTALKVDDSCFGYYEIARILKELGKLENAWLATKKAIENNPMIKLVYDMQFVEIALEAKKVEEAEKLLIKYINLRPYHSYPYLVAGTLQLHANNLDKALRYFEAAILKDKTPSVNDGKFYDYATVALLKAERHADAIAALNVVYSFDPQDKIKENIKKLEYLISSQSRSLSRN